MTSHMDITFDYDKQELLDLFNNSTKKQATNSSRILADLGDNVIDSMTIAPFFDKFSFIPRTNLSYELVHLVDKTKPHVSPGNAGLLIFPVSGSLTLNTYSYVSPMKDSAGRPTMDFLNMSAEEIAEIEKTKIESVVIDSPMAIDGLTTFSLEPTEPNTIVLILKIARRQSWDSVTSMLKTM